jgi:salicylate hydroxylase
VEDSVVLARLFSHLTSVIQVDEFLAAFQEIRYPRCEEIHTKEYGIIYFMTMPPSEVEEYRNQEFRLRRDAGLSYVDSDSEWEDSVEEKEIRDIFAYDANEDADSWWVEWGLLKDRSEGIKLGDELSTIDGKPLVVDVERSMNIVVQQFRFWRFY